MQFCRWLIIIFICLSLQACVSTRMSQELALGKLYFDDGNFKPAFRRLLPVAIYGKPQAQYAIGYMYYYGYGPSRDPESGIFWMNQAASQGYVPACKALELIGQGPPPCPVDLRANETCVTTKSFKGELIGARETFVQPVRQKPSHLSSFPRVRREPVAIKSDPLLPPRPVLRNSQPKIIIPPIEVSLKDSKFGLQVFGAFKLEDVKRLQAELGLQKKSKIWLTKNRGKDWYVLTVGNFSSFAEAKKANQNLTAELKDFEPWIRKLNDLKITV